MSDFDVDAVEKATRELQRDRQQRKRKEFWERLFRGFLCITLAFIVPFVLVTGLENHKLLVKVEEVTGPQATQQQAAYLAYILQTQRALCDTTHAPCPPLPTQPAP